MDAFAQLGLPRTLALEPESLEAAYAEASRRAHPDAGGSREAFETLARARGHLESPRARLLHWLELEGKPGELRGPIAPELLDEFTALGEVFQDTDRLIRERGAATSALGKALLEGRTQAARERLEGLQQRIEGRMAAAEARFPEVERGERDGWELARELGFLEKWRAEIRARFGQLW
jgi:hypothetical protein